MMNIPHRYLYALLLLLRYAQGCTTVVVNATSGGTVIGRTMELGIPLPDRISNTIWSLVATQRDEKRFGYAAISAALGGATSDAFVVEGMNERGFTVSVQTLQQSVYENHTTPAPQPVTFDRVAAYLLQRCASVADVAAALRSVAVVDNPLFAKLFGRCHWSVADSSGTSAVVEYLEGRLSIHDNSRIGVMTNDPHYEWHLHNLNGYAAYPTARDRQCRNQIPRRSFGTPSTRKHDSLVDFARR
jgi:choloylglycine hydrolase